MSADDSILIKEVAPDEFVFHEVLGGFPGRVPISTPPLDCRVVGLRAAIKLAAACARDWGVEYGYSVKFLDD